MDTEDRNQFWQTLLIFICLGALTTTAIIKELTKEKKAVIIVSDVEYESGYYHESKGTMTIRGITKEVDNGYQVSPKYRFRIRDINDSTYSNIREVCASGYNLDYEKGDTIKINVSDYNEVFGIEPKKENDK